MPKNDKAKEAVKNVAARAEKKPELKPAAPKRDLPIPPWVLLGDDTWAMSTNKGVLVRTPDGLGHVEGGELCGTDKPGIFRFADK